MGDRIFRLLSPLRAVAKRIGPASWREAAWNAEYRRGRNLHTNWSGKPSSICGTIERYSRGGDVLDLGCGDGHVGLGLDAQAYATYTGVEISPIAVDAARRKVKEVGGVQGQRNVFIAAEVRNFVPDRLVDVIVFKDSLYYFTRLELSGVLNHFKRFLKPAGVFVVQMDDLRRHGWIRSIIRKEYSVLEDHESDSEDYMRLVFR